MDRALAIFAAFGLLFSRVYDPKREVPVDHGPLEVADPSKLYFGERWEGEEFTWSVPIRNTTDHTLDITEVRTSCSCIAVVPPSLKLEPGEVQVITLAITASTVKSLNSDRVPTKIEVAGVVQNQPLPPIWLTGGVRPLAKLEPSIVQFEDRLICGQQSGSRKVKIATNSAVADLKVDAAADFELETTIEKVRGGYELVFSGRPRRIGKWEPILQLTASDAMGRRIGNIVVPIGGRVEGPVVVEPSEHYFGVVRAGNIQRLTIDLRSLTGKNYSVLDFGVSGNGLSVAKKPELAHYGLEWKISGDGEQRAKVEFRIKQEGLPPFAAIVQLVAYVAD